MMSKRCTYGIQSLVYLSREGRDRFVPVHEISEALSIPGSFLSKILAELASQHVVDSRKGPQGGVMLHADPEQLTLHDVVVAIDGPGLFEACVLGMPGCSQEAPCPLHAHWNETRACLRRGFAQLSIARLAMADGDANLPASFFAP